MLTGKKVKYTLEEKKELKKAALEQRDLYEKDHLGDFVKLYPVSEYQE
jgi:hypothetical protein